MMGFDKRALTALVLTVATIGGGPALADPGHGHGYGHERHEERREDRFDRREERYDRRDDRREYRRDHAYYYGKPHGDYRNWRAYDYNRYEPGYGGYYANRYYRGGYRPIVVTRQTRIYRGYDDRYYCRRSDGTTGLIVGAALGGIVGNNLDRGGSRVLGTVLGASVGAAIGHEIDRGQVVCR